MAFDLIARVRKERELLLGIDVESLTLDLAARLKKLPQVEYAQPNFLLRRFGLSAQGGRAVR